MIRTCITYHFLNMINKPVKNHSHHDSRWSRWWWGLSPPSSLPTWMYVCVRQGRMVQCIFCIYTSVSFFSFHLHPPDIRVASFFHFRFYIQSSLLWLTVCLEKVHKKATWCPTRKSELIQLLCVREYKSTVTKKGAGKEIDFNADMVIMLIIIMVLS